MTNLATFAQERARDYGSRTLAIVDGHPVAYDELADQAARVTGGLRDLGVDEGDRVAVMMATRAEFLYAWFGIVGAGAIEVPIHDAARGPGIAYILEATGARFVMVDVEHVEHVAPYIGDIETLEGVILVGEAPALDKPVTDFAELQAHPPAPFAQVAPDTVSCILFTGGTTGPPKGVTLTHTHNLNAAQGYAEFVGYTPDDVLYSVFPLFHANAKFMSVLVAMAVGAQLVIDRRFSASRFWATCREHRVTAFNSLGEMLRILLKQEASDRDRDNSVRMVVGAAAPAEVVEEFEQRFGVAVLDVYGLTETGPCIGVGWDTRRPGSCGLPTPWFDVKVVDEHDEEVSPHVKGQIVVRPRRPHVMMEGYWGNDSATLALMKNLWFHTGDYAFRDEDGFFWFRERATDSIRRRGENVSAWEIERVLAEHPQLLEAAAYGVPSDVGGQEVAIAVVLRDGEELAPEALLDYCTGRMAHFAVPRYVRFMDRLPRSHAQRVLKQELKADGTDADGVWDRESVGYVVQR